MGWSPWQLIVILVIVLLLFGTKRLRSLGSDLGGAIKGFKKSMNEEEDKEKIAHENGDAEFSEKTREKQRSDS